LPLHAQYSTRSFANNIKSVQIANYQRNPLYPVVDLASDEHVLLTFDDLNANEATYSYRIVHCTANWQKSTLQESEYMDGFFTNYIDHNETSFNTYFTYNHYELSIPNENWQFKISGNYAIEVFEDNNQDSPVLTACFSVVEPTVNILPEASARTNLSYQNTFQQVQIDIDYSQVEINDPHNDIVVVVEQNRRKDNRVVLTAPDFVERNKLRYLNNNKLIFEAGNEYRVFDISSEQVLSERIQSIDYFKPYFHATLYPDEIRSNQQYNYIQDVNGRYKINVQFSDQSQTDGDYYFTHFFLPVDQPFAGKEVYLMGEFTQNNLTPDARMTYNPARRGYEKTLLLKQGGYNYLYLIAPQGEKTGTCQPIEGNFWQTQNEYAIYVYHRPFGGKYEKLIGFCTVTANTATY
jgi:hypothetical protein